MNWDQIQGDWKTFKGKIKERWGRLSEDDLEIIKGKRQQLEGVLQKTYGKTKEEARKEIDEFCSRCG